MLCKDIIQYIKNELFPKQYSISPDYYGFQYKSPIINFNTTFRKVLISIGLDIETLHFAIKNKINLIISHHHLFNKKLVKFDPLMIKKLNLLSKQPIAIFSLGTSFIAAEGGVSDCICERIFCEISKTFEIRNNNNLIPIGRICFPNKYQSSKNEIKKDKIKLESLIKRIKHNFRLNILRYVGELNTDIKKICIIGGSFANTAILKKASKLRCDCFISGNFDYFESIYARQIGLNLIEIPHYSTENITLRNLTNILSLKFPHDEIVCFIPEDPIQFL